MALWHSFHSEPRLRTDAIVVHSIPRHFHQPHWVAFPPVPTNMINSLKLLSTDIFTTDWTTAKHPQPHRPQLHYGHSTTRVNAIPSMDHLRSSDLTPVHSQRLSVPSACKTLSRQTLTGGKGQCTRPVHRKYITRKWTKYQACTHLVHPK